MRWKRIELDSGDRYRGRWTLLLRITALAVSVLTFMPTYASVGKVEPEVSAQVEPETYLGNPLPVVDWVVAGVALLTALFAPGLATVAASLALFSLAFTAFSAFVDAGSGPSVSIEFGLPLGAASGGLLLWLGARPERDRNV